jgi:hypothetical protein
MADQGITLEDLTERYQIPSGVLENEVSIDDIKKISTFLESWKLVAPYLGLSKGDIEAIDRDGNFEEEKRLLMLQRWKQALVFKATYKKLVNALLSVKRADLAVNVCLTSVGAHLEGRYYFQPRPQAPPYSQTMLYCTGEPGDEANLHVF